MEKLYSNELKAVVILDNILENPQNVQKSNCLTVQHFDYLCEHMRNNSDSLFKATKSVTLRCTVRVNSPLHAKDFYLCLLHNGRYQFSFLFNATFNANGRLDNYEDGLVADGYVVRVDEDYNSDKSQKGVNEQMTLHVQLLVCSLTYLGRERSLTNTFIQ